MESVSFMADLMLFWSSKIPENSSLIRDTWRFNQDYASDVRSIEYSAISVDKTPFGGLE